MKWAERNTRRLTGSLDVQRCFEMKKTKVAVIIEDCLNANELNRNSRI